MGHQLHNELKKEFQLERLILFSDAVFAIAITLLAIEIKFPDLHGEEISEHILLTGLAKLIPKFIGFIVSFFLIGQYWVIHHLLFGFVINYNNKLLWLNMFYLFAIAVMPFSTGFYSEYVITGAVTPVIFYTANICLLGFVNFRMWRYIGNPKNNLQIGLTPPVKKYYSFRALLVPVIFIIFTIVFAYAPIIAFWIPVTIPVILKIISATCGKKMLTQKE